MLTRRAFVSMANVLSQFEDSPIKRSFIDSCVKVFSESNPRFDENRFRKACESS